MSIRVLAVYLFVGTLSVYAWKDWFKSFCGLILMTAVLEHDDMPKTILGIQGLNMWNVLLAAILLAWIKHRRLDGLEWNMPRGVNVLFLMYLGVIFVGFLRAAFDLGHMRDYSFASLVSEELINTFKWVVPAVLVFDGCRTRRQLVLFLICLFAMYLLIVTQVILRLPPSSVFNPDGNINATRKACSDIGYGACDMSTMLAGVFWAMLAVLPLVRKRKHIAMVVVAALMVMYGQALTGGRAGFVAWGATGLVLCLLKWRKYLILSPVIVMALPILFPGAAQRMLMGFGGTDVTGETTVNREAVTSDRTRIWPYVIDKIGESPIVGYGRLAMPRTDVAEKVTLELGAYTDQPHNMYLETLLDNGILGSIPVFLFFGLMVTYSATLFRSHNRLYSAVGGLSLPLVLTQLVAGIGSQHVYPEIGTLGMWAAIFLVLRVRVEEQHMQVSESFWYGSLQQRGTVAPV